MTQIRNIIYIFIIILFVVGCKKRHEIELCSYTYSDSLSYKEHNSNNHIGLISEIRLSQLKTNSDQMSEQRIVKNINNFIINEINSTYKDENPDSIVYHIASDNMSELLFNLREKNLIDDKDSTTSAIYDGSELSDTLYNRIYADCHYGLGDTIMCLRLSSSVYTGGAHPGKTTYCYSFSLNDGNMIRPNKIVTRNNTPELLNRIKKRLMEMKHYKNESELESNGFIEIYVSPYILLENDSICFFYESYSIAPFCEGDIEIKFSYKEIEDITLINK